MTQDLYQQVTPDVVVPDVLAATHKKKLAPAQRQHKREVAERKKQRKAAAREKARVKRAARKARKSAMVAARKARKSALVAARKAREAALVAARKARRETRMAPKHALVKWSLLVRDRDGNKCIVCGAVAYIKTDASGAERKSKDRVVAMPDGTEKTIKGHAIRVAIIAHHLLPKNHYPQLKFLPINGVAACPSCHKYHKFSWHGNPVWAMKWLQANRPEQYTWVMANVGDRQTVTQGASNG